MARSLYRFYLYTVCMVLLIFAMATLGRLLQVLLLFTPLRYQYMNVPASGDMIQAVVLFAVSWIAASLLGGLHYWLLRRDMQSDTGAGLGAIRSFFLNVVEGVSVIVTVASTGFFVLGMLASNSPGDITGAIAITLPALLLAVLLEFERRRTPLPATATGALIFQRIHFYGVQLILLLMVTFAWQSNFRPLVDTLFFGGKGTLDACPPDAAGCPTYNAFWLFVDLLWFALFWIGYGWLNRKDTATLPRLILHFAGMAYGTGFVLFGVYQGIALLLMPLFHLPIMLKDVTGFVAIHDFMSPLTFGLLVVGVYIFWLRDASRLNLIELSVARAVEWAIGAALAAAMFWWGCGYTLFNLLELASTPLIRPDATAWVMTLAAVIAGVGYIPLDIMLARWNATETFAAGARRGFILSLLGGGILTLAIGGVVALYTWVTGLIGSPITDWETVLHTSLAAFSIGVLLVGIYLTIALREKLFSSFAKLPQASSVVPVVQSPTVASETLEQTLDELVAGHITRDVAAARIRALTSMPLSVGR